MPQKIHFLLIFTIISGLYACSKPGETEVLEGQVNGLVNAIESRDKQQIKNYLAKDFSAGNDFNKTRFDVFLQYHLRRNKKISIFKSNVIINIKKSNADISAEVLLLGAGDWIPERGQKYIVESRWVKENAGWMMSRLRWRLKEPAEN